jgi:transposase-like protein
MARASKFTDEQGMEIALDTLSGKMSVSEVCRKWDIGTTYAYKLKDRAVELLRNGRSKNNRKKS